MFDVPLKVSDLMRDFEPDWFVAGGWAIDLFLGEETRPHADIEIAVFRRDQIVLQKYLVGWRLQKAENGVLSEWRKDDFLPLPVHEIHCFNEASEPHSLEILLNEANDARWIFRRDRRVTKPLSEVYRATALGVKILSPEIVLLYKSKKSRPKDERDFRATVNFLDETSKDWLKNALLVCYAKHDWLRKL